uniref:EF-hand domain-containing protein n=1 Tax=Echeneis naucrates TaxID=173247 RepID=A0A665UP76_ECHNA
MEEEDSQSVHHQQEDIQPVHQQEDSQSVHHQQEDIQPVHQQEDSGAEWDTDLETDDRKQKVSCAEVYLQACQQIGTPPISSFLRHMDEATFTLNHYAVGPLGAKALAIALQNITNLEMEDCLLKAQGARYLMEMLQTNITIQSLNLSNNQLQLEGAVAVSKMLSDNYYIKSIKLAGAHSLTQKKKKKSYMCIFELHLSGNGLSRVEAQSLGQALKQNNTLELLDLSHNRIHDEGVTLLCHGLATNDTLRVLKVGGRKGESWRTGMLGHDCHYCDHFKLFFVLSQNPMTEVGALMLLQTVTNNTKSAVEAIDISKVFVCEAFVELLEELRQRSPAMDVCYSVMNSVTRNLSALQIFQVKQNESIMDFFSRLDKEGTMEVSTAAFRRAVKVKPFLTTLPKRANLIRTIV